MIYARRLKADYSTSAIHFISSSIMPARNTRGYCTRGRARITIAQLCFARLPTRRSARLSRVSVNSESLKSQRHRDARRSPRKPTSCGAAAFLLSRSSFPLQIAVICLGSLSAKPRGKNKSVLDRVISVVESREASSFPRNTPASRVPLFPTFQRDSN